MWMACSPNYYLPLWVYTVHLRLILAVSDSQTQSIPGCVMAPVH